jgi:hypothetical protein
MLPVMELLNHLKIKIQFKNDSDSDSVSDEEGQEEALAYQILGTMHVGLPPQAKRLPILAKSPLQAVLQVTCSQGGFILCLRDWSLTTEGCNRGFMKIFFLIQAVHGVKTAPCIGGGLYQDHLRNKKGGDVGRRV